MNLEIYDVKRPSKMTLERYKSGRMINRRRIRAVNEMKVILWQARENIRKGYVDSLEGFMGEYMGYRDLAIKYGADVSQLPKTIPVPKNTLERLENKYRLI